MTASPAFPHEVRTRARRIKDVPPVERTRARQFCLSQAHAAEAVERAGRRFKRGDGYPIELHQGHTPTEDVVAFLAETSGATCGPKCYLVDCVPASAEPSEDEVTV